MAIRAVAASYIASVPAIASDKLPNSEKGATHADRLQEVTKVQIQGKLDDYDARRDETAGRLVIPHEELVKYGDTTTIEVLRRLPGISINGRSVAMRGLGAGYTQILLDGERMPPGFTIESITPSSIEKIEIIRSAVAEYSTQAIAGTINIILRKVATKDALEVRPAYGWAEGYRWPGLVLSRSRKFDVSSYSLTADLSETRFETPSSYLESRLDRRVDSLSQQRAARVAHGTYKSASLNGRASRQFSNTDLASIQSYLSAAQTRSATNVSVDTLFGMPPDNVAITNSDKNTNLVFKGDGSWAHQGESSKVEAKLGVSGSHNTSALRRTGWNSLNSLNMDRHSDLSTNTAGVNATLKASTKMSPSHSASAGAEFNFSRIKQDNRQVDLQLDAASPLNFADFDRIDSEKWAMYVQDDWSVSKQFFVYSGLRWESIRVQNQGRTAANRSEVLSPILQTLYKLPTQTSSQLRTAITRTFKAPTIDNFVQRRYVSSNNSPAEPDSVGNAGLRPELAWGLDLTYEYFWAPKAVLSISASTRRISDYIRSELMLQNGRWLSTRTNGGTATTRSIEVEIKAPLSAVVSTNMPITFSGNFSRNWSTVSDTPAPDNRLAEQTPTLVNLRSDYKSAKISAGAGYSLQTGGLSKTSANEAIWKGSRRDADIYLAWQFEKSSTLRFSINNLLHQDTLSASFYDYANLQYRRVNQAPTVAKLRLQLEKTF